MAAFIILAHCNPKQVARLASRLAPHYVYLHIDARVGDEVYYDFVHLLQEFPHVKLIARYRTAWGSWAIVEAILAGIKAALGNFDWSHLMVISGQDYPLVSSAEMSTFFNQHIGMSFVPHWYLPSTLWGNDGGMNRLLYWHTSFRGMRIFMPILRRQPKGIRHVGGSMFSCLTREMAIEVDNFADKLPQTANFYHHVWIPDEMYIPTVVMNSDKKKFVLNEALTYIRWSSPGSPHPDELKVEDISELISAGQYGSGVGGYGRKKLFARKINAENHPKLLDLLDQI